MTAFRLTDEIARLHMLPGTPFPFVIAVTP